MHLKSTIITSYNEIGRLHDGFDNLQDSLKATRVQLKQYKSKNRIASVKFKRTITKLRNGRRRCGKRMRGVKKA